MRADGKAGEGAYKAVSLLDSEESAEEINEDERQEPVLKSTELIKDEIRFWS
jgi:hypothetical protein